MNGREKDIKLFAFDVDGTLTSGTLFLGTDGEICKDFHVHDGMALSFLHRFGYKTVFITGRCSSIVERRAEELHVDHCAMKVGNKVQVLANILDEYGYTWEQVAFMGDDWNDLPVYEKVGISGCPANGSEENQKRADIVTFRKGGDGAVREFIKHILSTQDSWEKMMASFFLGEETSVSQ